MLEVHKVVSIKIYSLKTIVNSLRPSILSVQRSVDMGTVDMSTNKMDTGVHVHVTGMVMDTDFLKNRDTDVDMDTA